MDLASNAGGAGPFSFDDSSSPALPSTGRGRVRSADFGLPERSGLMDLVRTSLEVQVRLWPDLAGTSAVPATEAATIAAMADDFERRLRTQAVDIVQPGVAALTQLRDLLQGDVGIAAQVLKALVGDVVIEKQKVEGHAEPQMVARFTLNAVPALAVLDRGSAADHDGSNVSVWGSLKDDRGTLREGSLNQGEVSVPLLRMLPRKR